MENITEKEWHLDIMGVCDKPAATTRNGASDLLWLWDFLALSDIV